MKKLIIFVIAIIIFPASYSYSKIVMQPYLQALTDSSITVLLEADDDSKATVEYKVAGTNHLIKTQSMFSMPTELRKKTYVHRIQLLRLQKDMRYQYRAIHASDTSKWYEFNSAVTPGTNFRFAVMGDCRSNPDIHALIAKGIRKHNPVLSIYTGDLCFNSKYNAWKEEFFINDQLDLIGHVPFFNAIGNHEGWNINTKAFQQSSDINAGKEQDPWFVIENGDLMILILSTMHSCKAGSEQYQFAEKALKESRKKWKIVAFHHPAYCNGGHGENKEMIGVTKSLFEPYKVDIVVGGHSHFYQHNLINGIRHFVFGGGGAPLYKVKEGSYTLKGSKDYNFGIFDLTLNSINMTVYDHLGNEIDKLSIKK